VIGCYCSYVSVRHHAHSVRSARPCEDISDHPVVHHHHVRQERSTRSVSINCTNYCTYSHITASLQIRFFRWPAHCTHRDWSIHGS
jgi:hypothetical protein